jgi:hypothetical protein
MPGFCEKNKILHNLIGWEVEYEGSLIQYPVTNNKKEVEKEVNEIRDKRYKGRSFFRLSCLVVVINCWTGNRKQEERKRESFGTPLT